MNVFKKISLKYFNGSSNLNEGEERDIITSRDKAFIYACRKYNIDFEYYGFFSGAHFVEESDFEPEHSLIKCNFSELKKYNHFKWFAYLLSSQLDKERHKKQQEEHKESGKKKKGVQEKKEKGLDKKMHIREPDSMVIKDLSSMMILRGLITNIRVGGIISQENKLNANKRQLILTLLFTQCCKSLQQLIRK